MTSTALDSAASFRRRDVVRKLLVAFSLANLIFFPVWQEALHYPNEYYYEVPVAGRAATAAMIDVLLLTALVWGVAVLADRSGPFARRLARAALIASLLVPLNHVRTNLAGLTGGWVDTVAPLAFGPAAALVVFGIWRSLRGSKRIVRAAQLIVLVFLPYAALTFGQTMWLIRGGRDALFRVGPLAEPLAAHQAADTPRVLWIIFDQLDQELTFETLPTDVELPALHRLRNEAFSAQNAYAPGGWTIVSIPALLTGRFIERAKPAAANELRLKFLGESEVERWGAQPGIFFEARRRGLNTALAGNYHPYCRILSNELVSCLSLSYRQGVEEPCDSLLCDAARHWIGLAYHLPLVDRFGWIRDHYNALTQATPWAEAEAGIKRHRAIHQRVLDLAVDPDVHMVFAHYPVPHGPIIFNRHSNTFLRPGETADRLDNMVLADQALAELRAAMESAGLWARTMVIVSADHGEKDIPELALNAAGERIDRRVPFIVKLPFQQAPVRYSDALNTIVTAELILAVLDGEIVDTSALIAWLKQHSTFGKSPVFPGNAN